MPGLLWLSEPIVLACKVTFSLWKEGIPFYAVGCRWQGVVILSFSKELCFGELEGTHTHLAKLNGSLGVGTFTSSGHQAGVSTQQVCHLTHSWGLSKGSSGVAELVGFIPSTTNASVPGRNSHMWV